MRPDLVVTPCRAREGSGDTPQLSAGDTSTHCYSSACEELATVSPKVDERTSFIGGARQGVKLGKGADYQGTHVDHT